MMPSDPDSRKAGDAQYRIQLITWAGMLFAVVMYFLVIRMLPAPAARSNATLITALLVMAAGLVAASFPARRGLAGGGAAKRRQQALVVALVMCDAAALFGIVARFLTGTPQYYYFLALGLAGLAMHFPKRAE